jgi:hypothetical protein
LVAGVMESVPNVTNSQRVNTLADIPDFATGLGRKPRPLLAPRRGGSMTPTPDAPNREDHPCPGPSQL